MNHQNSVLFLSDADTAAALAWKDVIACLASAYSSFSNPEAAPPRAVARLGTGWLRTMAAIPPSGNYMGNKVIARARTRGVSYLIALWDRETAELVCLLDGKTITAMRTAATSAVAVDRLMKTGGIRVAVLGSGSEAASHVRAIAAVREIEDLRVFSPTPANRGSFARKITAELGLSCRAAESARDAIRGMDLVIAAARSRDEAPVLQGAWLQPGTMVVSIGSTLPEQREVDAEVVRRAELIVADMPEEVAQETGDMLAARDSGVAYDGRIVSLADLMQGRCPTTQRADNIVLFKSVGSGLQDIAVSELCYENAQQRGLGTVLALAITVKGGKK